MIENTIGIIAFILTIWAFYQIDRQKFLIINFFAVLFFGITLLISEAYIGGWTSIIASLTYLSAIFLNDKIQQKLQNSLPFLAFFLYILVDGFNSYIGLCVPIGTAIMTYATYEKDMIKNKLIMSIGLFFWLTYSFMMESYWAGMIDIIGILVLIQRVYVIKNLSGSNINLE